MPDPDLDFGDFGGPPNIRPAEQIELDKVEAAALSVVQNIDEKMQVVAVNTEVTAVEGYAQGEVRKVVDVVVGSSHIKNPG